MSNSRTQRLALFAGVVMAGAVGCGDNLADVQGHVTLNGKPLAAGDDVSGMVYFFPEGGTGAPALGLLDSEGAYQLATGSKAGIAPGRYLVTVTASKIIPSQTPGAPPSGRPITPLRYGNPNESGLTANVSDGSNEFDFALEGAPDTPRGRLSRRR